MKTLALIVAAGLAVALPALAPAAAPLAGEVQPLFRVKPEDRNAALKYWEASASLSSDVLTKVGEIDYTDVGTTAESAARIDSFQAAVKAASGFGTGEWVHATTYAKCDFEVRYEEGIMAMLPHLGKLRGGARFLRFEARRAIIDGRIDDAARYLVAIIRMGNHACGDGFLISSLVGNAIASLGMSEMKVLAESGKLTEEARAELRNALDGIDKEDPMRIRAAIVGEQTVMLEWIRNSFTGQDAGARLAEVVFQFQGAEGPLYQVHRAIVEKLDEKGVARELEQTEKGYQAMLDAWDAPDPVKACEEVAARMQKEEFGPLAAELCPAVSKARAAAERFEREVKETREALDKAQIAEPTSH